MVELADHDHHPPRPVALGQLPFHRESIRQSGELASDGVARGVAGIEFDAHEEGIAQPVVELLRFEDIPPALEQEGRDARGDAGAIGAGQGED